MFFYFIFYFQCHFNVEREKDQERRRFEKKEQREGENSDREKQTVEQDRERMAFVVRVNAFPEAAKKVEVEEESKCGQGTYVKRQALHPNTQKQKKRLGTVVP